MPPTFLTLRSYRGTPQSRLGAFFSSIVWSMKMKATTAVVCDTRWKSRLEGEVPLEHRCCLVIKATREKNTTKKTPLELTSDH